MPLVTFDAAGGTPTPAPTFAAATGEVADPGDPTRADYVFLGWRVGDASGVPWNFATDTTATDLTLVAAWELDTLTNAIPPEISGGSTLGSVLTASHGTWDMPDLIFSFEWFRGATSIVGATSATHTIVEADLGESLRVEVTAERFGDSHFFEATASSDPFVVPLGIITIDSAIVTGTTEEGHTLTASIATDPTGTVSHQWMRDGADIVGAVAATYTLVAEDACHQVSVRVTVTRVGYHDLEHTIDVGRILFCEFEITVAPEIAGTPGVGHTLDVSAGTWSPDPDSVTFAWLRNGVPISGAEAATYTLTAADEDAEVSVTVTASAPDHHDSAITVGSVLIDAEPGFVPDPVDTDTLTESARGGVASSQSGGTVTLMVPTALHDRWLYVYGHSTPVGLGWFHALGGSIALDVSSLPVGDHRLAVLTVDGSLAGWGSGTVLAAGLSGTGVSGLHLWLLLSVGGALVTAGAVALMRPRLQRARGRYSA